MMGELPTSVLLPYGVVTPPVMDVGEAVCCGVQGYIQRKMGALFGMS
jgi:hypothetical protein